MVCSDRGPQCYCRNVCLQGENRTTQFHLASLNTKLVLYPHRRLDFIPEMGELVSWRRDGIEPCRERSKLPASPREAGLRIGNVSCPIFDSSLIVNLGVSSL